MRFSTLTVRCTVALLALSATLAVAAPKKVALLVGVGNNPHTRPLEGPAHDVEALRQVLSERWEYAPKDIRTLLDKEATHGAIVAELNQLLQRTAPGDEVLLFIAGHGTSALQGDYPVPDGSGAFWAYDTSKAGDKLLVGRTDIRPVLEKLDQGGRKVWFVADTCFSQNMARSYGKKGLTNRMAVQVDDKATLKVLAQARDRYKARETPPAWPYKNVVFLSSSSEGEPAQEIGSAGLDTLPTVDGKPHGAMTDALLRVLKGELPADIDRNGAISLQEVYETTTQFMATRPYGQLPLRSPTLKEDVAGLVQQPLLRGSSVKAPPRQAIATPQVLVHVDAGLSSLPTEVLAKIRAVPGVRLVGKNEGETTARLVLRKSIKDGTRMVLETADESVIAESGIDKNSRIPDSLHQIAWVRKMESVAQAGRRAVLNVEISPAELGVNREVGDKLDFLVRPDQDAHLLMLNVNGEGAVSVIYPYQPHDLTPIRQGEVKKLLSLPVEPPVGMDVQLFFVFDKKPANLDRQLNRLGLQPGDARLAELEQMVADAKEGYAFARTEFRTHAAGTLTKK